MGSNFIASYLMLFLTLFSFHLAFNKSKEQGFPGGSVVKNLSANAGNAGDTSSIPG